MMRFSILRTLPCVVKHLHHSSSTSVTAVQQTSRRSTTKITEKEDIYNVKYDFNKKKKLVKAAFQNLTTTTKDDEPDIVSQMMIDAKSIENLLDIVTDYKFTKKHALKFTSILADWTVQGKIQTSDFENDPRFAIVCKLLHTEHSTDTKGKPSETDLNTVIGVTSDYEAAKLISRISLSQMVKILSTLASKKRRSTPLLRSLAFNIASCHDKLDIKQGADALYALASLNYHDEMVIDKICDDLCGCLMENKRRAVVGSVITSLGLLRYKHVDLLNLLSEWVQKNIEVCTPQDLTSLVMTLAIIYHKPANQDILFPLLGEHLDKCGMEGRQEWLDLVWALTILNKQTSKHVADVLSPVFVNNIKTINTDGLTIPMKMKFLNINGVAKTKLKDYKGPLLDLTSPDWNFPILRSKERQSLVGAVQEAMLNILPSAIYLSTNVETGMGYVIDAECLVNTNLSPLPLYDKKTNSPIDRTNADTQKGIKVAIIVYDYHDMTRGRRELLGINVLHQELTRLNGYRVMKVDFLDFNPRSKLAEQVQYLSQQLKVAVGIS